jgi:hypothetical protein
VSAVDGIREELVREKGGFAENLGNRIPFL